ncbi:MAG: c-type cytochrome, partial [Gammaproteobacteria bacterium]|nr:c-type cytochrome [Gammaproteobacteria bacterium]
KQFLYIVAFSVFVVSLFAGYANFGIPEIQPAPPPSQEAVDLSSMDMDTFISLGEKLYTTKGTCTLCHNELGRAPMLDNLDGLVAQRLGDDGYGGSAKDVASYLIESMNEPSIYVVKGFGKVGTNDQESPMPDVRSGSIGLSDAETLAIVAYLEDASGLEVSVEIPQGESAPVEEAATESAGSERAHYTTGEEIVAVLGCGACHKIGEFQGELGPDLQEIGSLRDREHLRRSILDPNADITEGFVPMMPPVYADQLYASELELLVDYMASLK